MSELEGAVVPDEPRQERPVKSESPPKTSRGSVIRNWLAHPLLLLLVGALVTSILVPVLTHQWQNHEKELEIKSGLAEQINNSVTNFVMAVQFAEVGVKSQSQAQYDKAYRDWEVIRGQLESKIRVYFPTTRIADDWDRYSATVTHFYILSGTSVKSRRAFLVRRMTESLGGGNFEGLVDRAGPGYLNAWEAMKDRLLHKKDEFIQRILSSPSALD
jgi:hypothetical protein